MHPYLAHTDKEIEEMLEVIGLSSIDELFSDIPKEVLYKEELDIPKGQSELEIRDQLNKLSLENISTNDYVSFLGGGAYDHYIPSIIPQLLLRQEFYTAYTPYQPEISQGTLQAIFEYQSMICELTGLDASNASLYDGATAAAESLFMTYEAKKKKSFLISENINPEIKKVVKTYLTYKGLNYLELKSTDGLVDLTNLKDSLNLEIGGVLIQSPNYYGLLEDVSSISELVHENKSLLIQSADPIALGTFKSPKETNVDIVVGEGQVLGNALNFGGPYLGYISCTKKLQRKLPGRIVGQTTDLDGKRAFVLTLQAREQHIRREKATSNITSNEALNALAATIYLSVLGKQGILDVAKQCIDLSYYTADLLIANNKFELKYTSPFFREFVIKTPIKAEQLIDKMFEKKFFAGIDMKLYNGSDNELLIAVTEKMTKENIDDFVKEMEACINE